LVSLSDTITTESAGASWCASGGSGDTGITLFIRIDNTITTEVASAVKSASVREGIGIGSTIIAIFVSLFDSVSAISSAARASVIIDIVSVVTLFSGVNDTISAVGVSAAGSAGVRSGIASVGSGIALFATEVVNNTVTTSVQLAIHTASVGSGIAVSVICSCGEFQWVSVVASFVEVSVNLSVTASEGAISEAQPGVNTTRVTILSEVNNLITARGRAARSD